MDGFEVRWDLY